MNSDSIQQAIRRSLLTEKAAMDFYRTAAQHIRNPEARRMLELLAKEEREHAEWFHRICTSMDLEEFQRLLSAAPDPASDWYQELQQLLDSKNSELDVLQLAMQKEKRLEQELREIADSTEDAEARQIYEANINSTRSHFDMIAEEYRRLKELLGD